MSQGSFPQHNCYTAELFVRGDVLGAGVSSLTESHFCSTSSLSLGLPVFWCFVCLAFLGGAFFVVVCCLVG